MTMEETRCSETSAYKIQTPGNYPKERIEQLRLAVLYLLARLLWKDLCLYVQRWKLYGFRFVE